MRRILILFFLFVSALYSQPKIDSLIIKGVKFTDNLEFGKAELLFNEFIAKNKNLPDGYYFISQIYFWKFLANRDSADYLIYSRFVNIADSLVERGIPGNSAWENFVAGSIHATKAAAFSTYGKNMKAFFETKKAVTYFNEAIELDSNFADPYYGLGIFNYALSFLPPIFKVALDITGLSHSKQKAISFLKKSFGKGIVTKDESGFNLSKIYAEYLGELDSAEYYINIVLHKDSDNILFSYQKALIKVQKKELSSAEEILKNIIKSPGNNFEQTKALSYFLLGEIYFFRNNFNKAITYYDKFFETAKTIDYVGFASLRVALAAKFIGADSLFYENITTTDFGNGKIPEDKFAKSFGAKLLKKGINEGTLNVVKALNYFESGEYSNGLDFCDSIIERTKGQKYLPEIKIIKAAILTEQKKFTASIEILKSVKPLNLLREILTPLKLISLVRDYLFIGKTNLARKYFLKLKNTDLKNFKNKFEAKINYLGRHYFSEE